MTKTVTSAEALDRLRNKILKKEQKRIERGQTQPVHRPRRNVIPPSIYGDTIFRDHTLEPLPDSHFVTSQQRQFQYDMEQKRKRELKAHETYETREFHRDYDPLDATSTTVRNMWNYDIDMKELYGYFPIVADRPTPIIRDVHLRKQQHKSDVLHIVCQKEFEWVLYTSTFNAPAKYKLLVNPEVVTSLPEYDLKVNEYRNNTKNVKELKDKHARQAKINNLYYCKNVFVICNSPSIFAKKYIGCIHVEPSKLQRMNFYGADLYHYLRSLQQRWSIIDKKQNEEYFDKFQRLVNGSVTHPALMEYPMKKFNMDVYRIAGWIKKAYFQNVGSDVNIAGLQKYINLLKMSATKGVVLYDHTKSTELFDDKMTFVFDMFRRQSPQSKTQFEIISHNTFYGAYRIPIIRRFVDEQNLYGDNTNNTLDNINVDNTCSDIPTKEVADIVLKCVNNIIASSDSLELQRSHITELFRSISHGPSLHELRLESDPTVVLPCEYDVNDSDSWHDVFNYGINGTSIDWNIISNDILNNLESLHHQRNIMMCKKDKAPNLKAQIIELPGIFKCGTRMSEKMNVRLNTRRVLRDCRFKQLAYVRRYGYIGQCRIGLQIRIECYTPISLIALQPHSMIRDIELDTSGVLQRTDGKPICDRKLREHTLFTPLPHVIIQHRNAYDNPKVLQKWTNIHKLSTLLKDIISMDATYELGTSWHTGAKKLQKELHRSILEAPLCIRKELEVQRYQYHDIMNQQYQDRRHNLMNQYQGSVNIEKMQTELKLLPKPPMYIPIYCEYEEMEALLIEHEKERSDRNNYNSYANLMDDTDIETTQDPNEFTLMNFNELSYVAQRQVYSELLQKLYKLANRSVRMSMYDYQDPFNNTCNNELKQSIFKHVLQPVTCSDSNNQELSSQTTNVHYIPRQSLFSNMKNDTRIYTKHGERKETGKVNFVDAIEEAVEAIEYINPPAARVSRCNSVRKSRSVSFCCNINEPIPDTPDVDTPDVDTTVTSIESDVGTHAVTPIVPEVVTPIVPEVVKPRICLEVPARVQLSDSEDETQDIPIEEEIAILIEKIRHLDLTKPDDRRACIILRFQASPEARDAMQEFLRKQEQEKKRNVTYDDIRQQVAKSLMSSYNMYLDQYKKRMPLEEAQQKAKEQWDIIVDRQTKRRFECMQESFKATEPVKPIVEPYRFDNVHEWKWDVNNETIHNFVQEKFRMYCRDKYETVRAEDRRYYELGIGFPQPIHPNEHYQHRLGSHGGDNLYNSMMCYRYPYEYTIDEKKANDIAKQLAYSDDVKQPPNSEWIPVKRVGDNQALNRGMTDAIVTEAPPIEEIIADAHDLLKRDEHLLPEISDDEAQKRLDSILEYCNTRDYSYLAKANRLRYYQVTEKTHQPFHFISAEEVNNTPLPVLDRSSWAGRKQHLLKYYEEEAERQRLADIEEERKMTLALNDKMKELGIF